MSALGRTWRVSGGLKDAAAGFIRQVRPDVGLSGIGRQAAKVCQDAPIGAPSAAGGES
jgi:hypothetical protein